MRAQAAAQKAQEAAARASSAAVEQAAKRAKTQQDQADQCKYRCPDCRLPFAAWSQCRQHLLATGHASPSDTNGLQQRCMIKPPSGAAPAAAAPSPKQRPAPKPRPAEPSVDTSGAAII